MPCIIFLCSNYISGSFSIVRCGREVRSRRCGDVKGNAGGSFEGV